VSLAVSTVLHVVALLLMAMIVNSALTEPRLRPIDVDTTPEPEFEELAEVPVEAFIEPPQPDVAEAVIVESAAPSLEEVDPGAVEPTAVSLDAEPAAWDAVAEGLLGGVGSSTGAGPGDRFGGFAGEVGRRLKQAGAKTGAIQVSLAWNNGNDLDLHVVTPRRERIFFGHRISACQGQLDVDMNAGGPLSQQPVENVFWAQNRAPYGRFHVFVHHFATYGGPDPTAFEVYVLVDGQQQKFTGQVSFGQPPVEVASFEREVPSTIGTDPADDFRE
jgi:hypothetical protein